MDIGLGLLNAIVTLLSFVVILWGLSAAAPLHLFGKELAIPGYLVWGALLYAIFGTVLTQWIGSPLVDLDFEQQQREADFRFNLVRARENAEQIALMQGEPAERERLAARFERVIDNWYGIMSRTKRLTSFTQSYSQAAVVFPYVLVAPAYFAGKVQLGGMMQTASAFDSVHKSLSFFVSVYRRLAEWRAVVARLDGFETSIASAAALATKSNRARSARTRATIELNKLLVRLPNGTPMVSADAFRFRAGERTLITGPSGSGKSTLFRAIAGIWPFGERHDRSRQGHADDAAATAVFPDRPRCTPRSPTRRKRAFSPEQVREVLGAVGLGELAQTAGRRGALEPDALARRAAAARHRPRAAAYAAIPVPR